MPRESTLSIVLRIVAGIVLAAGAVIGALAAGEAIDGKAVYTNSLLAAGSIAATLGVAGLLWGLSELLSPKPQAMPPELTKSLARMHTQLNEIWGNLNEIHATCDRLARAEPQQQATAPPSALSLTPSDLEPLYQALREIRELTLLPDSERRQRLERYRAERQASLIRQAFDLVASRQWGPAERLVLSLETEFPNNDEVGKARNYLNHARRLHEEETVARIAREADELMSVSNWDAAYVSARTLVDGFPDNPRARELLLRVQRERETFQESTVARMFDELRNDIERRMWRRALLHAQNLLERFPTNPRAEGVRRQLRTIHDNAEIEERQELEVRIQELIKAQRFDEAISLGEDLIRRYPNSPQAESLDTLLPRLRELAAETRTGPGALSGLAAQIDEEDFESRQQLA